MPPSKGRSRRTAPIDFPEAMVFHPTMEEFSDFPGYIAKIERMNAHQAGICKIVPPKEWVPRKIGYAPEDFPFRIEKPLKQCFTEMSESGAYQTKCLSKGPMSIREFYELANSRQYKTPPHDSYEDLEKKYWKSLGNNSPIYGADVTEAITDPEVKEFNIAKLDSILKYVEEDSNQTIFGVNSPYIYFGMWKATFSWHIEDMDLYGINFVHHGAPKTWYCVPPKYGHLMEKAARELFPNVATWCSNFMRHKTCLISPSLLEELGVPFQKMVQEERNIIIVFPYAYHAGFNHGFNIAESTNFATERWIEYGKRHRPCDCSTVRVKIDMGIFVKRYQPDLYKKWCEGKDIAPHPEDPEDIAKEIKLRAENPEAYAKMLEERMGVEDEDVIWYAASDGRHLRYDVKRDKFTSKIKLTDAEMKRFENWKADTLDGKNYNRIVYDIYQHVDMPRLKVKVFHDTKNCSDSDLEKLQEFLDKPELRDVFELINKGDMIKIGTRSYFIPKKNIEKEDKMLEVKKETEENKPLMPEPVVKQRVVVQELLHLSTNETVFVNMRNLSLMREVSSPQLKKLLEDRSIARLIDEGILQPVKGGHKKPIWSENTNKIGQSSRSSFDQNENVSYKTQMNIHSGSTKTVGMVSKDIDESPGNKNVTGAIRNEDLKSGKGGCSDSVNKEERSVVRHNIYHHRNLNVSVIVDPDTNQIVEVPPRKLKNLIEKISLKTLIDQKQLVLIGERHVSSKSLSACLERTDQQDVDIRPFNITIEDSIIPVMIAKNSSRMAIKLNTLLEDLSMFTSKNIEDLEKEGILKESLNEGNVREDDKQTLSEIIELKDLLLEHSTADATNKSKVKKEKTLEIVPETSEKIPTLDNCQNNEKNDLISKKKLRKHCHNEEKLLSLLQEKGFSSCYNENSMYVLKNPTEEQMIIVIVRNIELSSSKLKCENTDLINATESEGERLKPCANTPQRDGLMQGEEEYEEIRKTVEALPVDEFDDLDIMEIQSDFSDEAESDENSSGEFDSDDPDYGEPLQKRPRTVQKLDERKEKAEKATKKGEKIRRRRNNKGCMNTKRRQRVTLPEGFSTSSDLIKNLEKLMEHMSEKVEKHPDPTKNIVMNVEQIEYELGVQTEAIKKFIPVFIKLKIVQNEEQNLDEITQTKLLWKGLNNHQTSDLIKSILEEEFDDSGLELENTDLWLPIKLLLRFFSLKPKDSDIPMSQIDDQICCRQDLCGKLLLKKSKIRAAIAFLIGIGLLSRKSLSNRTFMQYKGPEVYEEWLRHKFSPFDGMEPKIFSLKLYQQDITGLDVPRRHYSSGLHSIKKIRKSILEHYSETMDENQRKSIQQMNKVCRCGGSKLAYESTKSNVRFGFKRKKRCKKCIGCLAEKCNSCMNCLNPSNKQTCVQRICLFPVAPKCPCFQ